MISNKVSFRKKGFKYFIGYQYDGKIRPLCILLPKTSGYKTSFHKTNYASVLTEDEKLLKASNKVWDQMSNIMEKKFDSKPAYTEKHFKMKCYGNKINANLHDEGTPKEGCDCFFHR